jgi:hypothetical protein
MYKQGFSIKPSYHLLYFVKVQLQKGMSKSYNQGTFDLSQQVLPQKYENPVQLSPEKVQDLKALLMHMPSDHKQFLAGLIAVQGVKTLQYLTRFLQMTVCWIISFITHNLPHPHQLTSRTAPSINVVRSSIS